MNTSDGDWERLEVMVMPVEENGVDRCRLWCTIFKKDKPEAEFFKKALKFEQDETSFVDTVHEQFEYEILSRPNLIKKKRIEEEVKRIEEEENNQENVAVRANHCPCPTVH